MKTEPKLSFKGTLFVDSGAHGLYNEHVRGKSNINKYKWYYSDEFYQYLEKYALFIKDNFQIDIFVNVDVIFNPELTWKIQSYFEKKYNLRPMPIIHFGTSKKWLKRYMEKGYSYIGIGGLGQGINRNAYIKWADEIFDFICDRPSRLPKIKTHGFAMTSHSLMSRYPWYSVDSTSWISYGSYGQVIFPNKKEGKWDYSSNFNLIRLSVKSSLAFNKICMVNLGDYVIKKLFIEYIEEKGYVLGNSKLEGGEEVIIEKGLCNDDKLRCDLNALYFLDFASHQPKWPWAFKQIQKGGFLL